MSEMTKASEPTTSELTTSEPTTSELTSTEPTWQTSPLDVIARIRRPAPPPDPTERCELCKAEIPEEHPHLVDLEGRGLLCSCRPCWFLFNPEGAGGRRYRAVPERYLSVEGFSLSPAQWDSLQIPVAIAFFFHNSTLDKVAAFYPSPAGATESLLSLDAWSEIVADNPLLSSVLPDVEAVLMRTERGVMECFIVPIDTCYELVGRLRQCWRGFDGGQEAHQQLLDFFDRIHHKSRAASASGNGHG
jgi:hypothetical protein